jgi:hypothetical protein
VLLHLESDSEPLYKEAAMIPSVPGVLHLHTSLTLLIATSIHAKTMGASRLPSKIRNFDLYNAIKNPNPWTAHNKNLTTH